MCFSHAIVIVYAYRSYSSTCPCSKRKLPSNVRAKASNLLQMNANKKMVQMQLTGKVILLKDLANVVTSAKQSDTRNSVI